MKSPFEFIVKPVGGKRYDNIKKIGGTDFIVSTSEEDFKHSNRYAEVVEVPILYKGPIKPSDILLVHHNVFKFYNDIKGGQRSGKSYFKDDLFFVDVEQFFMHYDGEEWHPYDRFCFIEPIPTIESYIYKPFSEEPLIGKMKYPNEYLKSQGVKVGDLVTFLPETEYEFNVDGEKLYRMYDHHISMVL
jgi:hypothetical protein|tara:strand:- start:5115 stop:5678 length:564 start_codon:yes stop_codon:yes gene_type:complete